MRFIWLWTLQLQRLAFVVWLPIILFAIYILYSSHLMFREMGILFEIEVHTWYEKIQQHHYISKIQVALSLTHLQAVHMPAVDGVCCL